MSGLRIVLADGGSFARYPLGGGHWSCFLQYLFGLNALGHDVFWLEVFQSCGNAAQDQESIDIFFKRFERYGFKDRCALLLYNQHTAEPTLEGAHAYGMNTQRIRQIAQDAEMLWDFACGLPQSLLSLFRKRVLIDGDPGHLQVSALTCDMGINDHDVFMTVGTKFHDPDCEVPTLGVKWHRFIQFVYLPMWNIAPDPGENAPFTSVTEWTWEQLWMDGRVLSVSKREAYLKYIDLPQRSRRAFELAANIHPEDSTGDRQLLLRHDWKLAHPHSIAGSPASYQEYIKRSRAELLCPKPIHRQLKSGWFSDRSACYLAAGRPVITQDTGFGKFIPIGEGLFAFSTMEEIVAALEAINSDYERHGRAARAIAEEYFRAETVVAKMLEDCGIS